MTLDEIRRRPTLPGRFQPSTISVLRLNFCVRDGNRWVPQAIVTGNMGLSRSLAALLPSTLSRFSSVPLLPSHRSRFATASASLPLRLPFPRTLKTAQVAFTSLRLTLTSLRYSLQHSSFISSSLDQALDRLVSPSSIHYCTSTDDLSTLSSSRGLTCF